MSAPPTPFQWCDENDYSNWVIECNALYKTRDTFCLLSINGKELIGREVHKIYIIQTNWRSTIQLRWLWANITIKKFNVHSGRKKSKLEGEVNKKLYYNSTAHMQVRLYFWSTNLAAKQRPLPFIESMYVYSPTPLPLQQ